MATRHWFGAYNDSTAKGNGHPIMWGNPKPTRHFDPFPDGGGYPLRFVEWALKEMDCPDPNWVLNLCSGSMRSGITVDIRSTCKPMVVADVRKLPFRDETFSFVLADPPYSLEYAANLYGTEAVYPKPAAILREAERVLRPGGKVGILHTQVPYSRWPLKLLGTYGITTGAGYAIRVFSLFRKEPSRMIRLAS